MIIISEATKPLLEKWHAESLHVEHIWRYEGADAWIGTTISLGNGWDHINVMSDCHRTLMGLHFNREMASLRVRLSIWGLDTNVVRRRLSCGKLLLELPTLLKRVRAKEIGSVVHENNADSLALSIRLFGLPWGREPSGAYDRVLGKTVDLFYFKRTVNHETEWESIMLDVKRKK